MAGVVLWKTQYSNGLLILNKEPVLILCPHQGGGSVTYIGAFVVEQVVMIHNEPALLPVGADSAATMFVQPTHLPGVLKRSGSWTLRTLM